MIYGFIIAAGKQTRFNSSTPKALALYKDKPILDYNIDLMKKYCNKIYVVCSEDKKKYFELHNINKKYELVVIKENLGCGDTITKALDICKPSTHDFKCIIQWGDCIQTESVYKSIDFNDSSNRIQIPCYKEFGPYVNIEVDTDFNIKEVQFSKFEEVKDKTFGFHDCCLFYGNYYTIYNYCLDFMTMFRDKNNYKDFGHGNEFNFLDIFNKLHARGFIKEVNGDLPKSFNTIYELHLCGGTL